MQNIVMNVAVMEMTTILMKTESGYADVLNANSLRIKMMMTKQRGKTKELIEIIAEEIQEKDIIND